MGFKYSRWRAKSDVVPGHLEDLTGVLWSNRQFEAISALEYGDYGLEKVFKVIKEAIESNKKITFRNDLVRDSQNNHVTYRKK